MADVASTTYCAQPATGRTPTTVPRTTVRSRRQRRAGRGAEYCAPLPSSS